MLNIRNLALVILLCLYSFTLIVQGVGNSKSKKQSREKTETKNLEIGMNEKIEELLQKWKKYFRIDKENKNSYFTEEDFEQINAFLPENRDLLAELIAVANDGKATKQKIDLCQLEQICQIISSQTIELKKAKEEFTLNIRQGQKYKGESDQIWEEKEEIDAQIKKVGEEKRILDNEIKNLNEMIGKVPEERRIAAGTFLNLGKTEGLSSLFIAKTSEKWQKLCQMKIFEEEIGTLKKELGNGINKLAMQKKEDKATTSKTNENKDILSKKIMSKIKESPKKIRTKIKEKRKEDKMEQDIELMDKLNVIEGQMGEFWAKFVEFEQICGVNLDQTLPKFCRNDQKSAKSAKKEPTKTLLKGLAKQIEAVKNDLVPELEVVINEKKLENARVKSTKLLFDLDDLQLKTETKRRIYDEIGREISQNLVNLNEDRAKKKALKDAIQQNAKSAKKQMENIGKMLKKFKNLNSKKMGASASN